MTATAEETTPTEIEDYGIKGVQTLHTWSKRTGVPYTILRDAVRTGRLSAYRFTPTGRYYVVEDEIRRYISDSRLKYTPLTP